MNMVAVVHFVVADRVLHWCCAPFAFVHCYREHSIRLPVYWRLVSPPQQVHGERALAVVLLLQAVDFSEDLAPSCNRNNLISPDRHENWSVECYCYSFLLRGYQYQFSLYLMVVFSRQHW